MGWSSAGFATVSESFIPIARPLLGEREADAIRRPLLSGWVTQGPEVAAFEAEFAAFVGAEHACAVSNCTTALHLALRALGVGQGDEVVTVSHSFIATANVVRHVGATPVFVDIEAGTYNMTPDALFGALSPRTRAILCVHQMGMPCDLGAILPIAREAGVPVIEDAACAIGSEIRWEGEWQPIGRPHADIACFSFHPRKVITTGDGGMLTTNDPDLDASFRLGRHHGMGVPDTVRHGAPTVIFETYDEVGFNYRLTDIQAAVGREQLARLPEILGRRRALAERYREAIAALALDIGLPVEPEWARSNWQSYCIRLPDGVDQREAMQSMLDAGVATRRGVMCAHREPAYRTEPWGCSGDGLCDCAPGTCRNLAESECAQDRTIVIPLYAQMTDVEQDIVVAALRAVCGEGRAGVVREMGATMGTPCRRSSRVERG